MKFAYCSWQDSSPNQYGASVGRKQFRLSGNPDLTSFFDYLAKLDAEPTHLFSTDLLLAWFGDRAMRERFDLRTRAGRSGFLFACTALDVGNRFGRRQAFLDTVRAGWPWPAPASGIDGLPLTWAMVAAATHADGDEPPLKTVGQRIDLVKRYYLSLVPTYGLSAVVTAAERDALNRVCLGEGTRHPIGLIMAWAWSRDPALMARFPIYEEAGRRAYHDWYHSRGCWLLQLDYALPAPLLQRNRIDADIDGRPLGRSWALLGDGFFDSSRTGTGLIDPAKLAEFVLVGRSLFQVSPTAFGPGALYFAAFPGRRRGRQAWLGRGPDRVTEPGDPAGSLPVPAVRPGDLINFCHNGKGAGLLLPGGWHGIEAEHTWSARPSAFVSFPLAGDGPLDLFVYLKTVDQAVSELGITVLVTLNGVPLAFARLDRDRNSVIHAHVGTAYRTGGQPNLLAFHLSRTWSPRQINMGADDRQLGVGLIGMLFVER